MRQTIKCYIELEREEGKSPDIDLMADLLYNDYINFNNADVTSGQRCYDINTIKRMIKEEIRK